jgi:hypothetical protein
MATTIRARIYARGEVSFAKFLFLPSWFAKLLETNFSCFAKIIWMPSWFAKLLKLLLKKGRNKKGNITTNKMAGAKCIVKLPRQGHQRKIGNGDM